MNGALRAHWDRPTADECEKAGRDSVMYGCNSLNCHFRFFSTRDRTDAWERGKALAETEKVKS